MVLYEENCNGHKITQLKIPKSILSWFPSKIGEKQEPSSELEKYINGKNGVFSPKFLTQSAADH